MILDKIQSIDAVEVSGKRVLYRADLNVPSQGGVVTDLTRIERVIPGIQTLSARKAKVIVLSHYGRPKKGFDTENSLRPVAEAFKKLLNTNVSFVSDCVGQEVEASIKTMNEGDILILENTRFYSGEESNDLSFTSKLAQLGDLYVNDAFSVSHRAHATTEGLTHYLPSYAGPLLLEEINALKKVLENPRRPTAAIIGGAKVSTKIPILTNLVPKFDYLIIGGGMANTFIQSQGIEVGRSLAEPDYHGLARDIMAEAEKKSCKIILPVDVVVAREFRAGAPCETLEISKIPKDCMILDVGQASIDKISNDLKICRTLLWNGPLGAFEFEPFGAGTFALAREAAKLTLEGRLTSIAGGGDTVAALNSAGVTQDFTYVSTAGGAFLEWLEGKELPGIAALAKN
ncbi:MAG: phosphoglycerate kinase [Hyphomicrobium sp.]